MRINKTKSSGKNLKIALSAAILIIACGLALYAWNSNHRKDTLQKPQDDASRTIDYNRATDDQLKSGQAAKDDTVNNSDSGKQGQDANTIDVSLNAIQNGNQVAIDTLIKDVIANGRCTLTITNASKQVVKNADTFTGPATSSCKGFSIQTDELPTGLWALRLDVSTGVKNGSATTSLEVR